MCNFEIPKIDRNKKENHEVITESFREFCKKHAVFCNHEYLDEDESNVVVKYTLAALDYDFGYTRRPVYSLRGKPVSKELAMHIIRLTDTYLHTFTMCKQYRDKNKVTKIFADYGVEPKNYYIPSFISNYWFAHCSSTYFGWCHPDGYIGLTYYTWNKNPEIDEFMLDWVNIINKVTKELDIVLAVTDLDERIQTKDVMEDHIIFGLHIKGDVIEVLDACKARMMHRKYDREYGDHTKNGPLVDARKIDDYKSQRVDRSKTIWGNQGCWDLGNAILWGDDDNCWLPVEGGVDKNNPQYYGVPDYTFTTSPVTMDDLEVFAQKFKEEQEQEQKKS